MTYRLVNNATLVLESFVSLKRTQEFLLLGNLPGRYQERESLSTHIYHEATKNDLYHATLTTPHSQTFKRNEHKDIETKTIPFPPGTKQQTGEHSKGLTVSCLTYSMRTSSDRCILHEISFNVPARSLAVVTGPVGSGKSTLLSALAGELPISSGEIVYSGNIVYVPQTAWLFSGSIRDNILFGKPYNKDEFANVLEVCDLQKDVRRLPQGDLTFVGERGVVLSGGQRARVSLARAVYADADFYLLDDPLSAVDAKVGEHIFNKCICQKLRDKTRILVSHDGKHRKAADKVLALDEGFLVKRGDFLEMEKEIDSHGTLNSGTMYERKRMTNQRTEDQAVKPFKAVQPPCDVSPPERLEILQEDRAVGTVSFRLYWNYFTAGMHPIAVFGIVALFLATQGLNFIAGYTVHGPKSSSRVARQ